MASAPESLDPRFATSAVATRLAQLVAAPLVSLGEDLQPRPYLAEHITRDDPKTWTITLREGAFFHDGAPVTARDVAWTFRSMQDPATASPHAGRLTHLKDIEVVDGRTVRFHLDEPLAPFLVDLNAWGILSSASCGADSAACRRIPVGAGPWRVVRPLDDHEAIQLEAWDRGPAGAPAIRRIEVRVARDNSTRLFSMLDGRVDLIASDLLPTDIEVLREAGIETAHAEGLGLTYLAFNVRGPSGDLEGLETRLTRQALADARVRRALALAIDVDAIIETKLRARATRATGLLPEGHWASDPAARPLPHDPALAERMLDEAGYPKRLDGGRFHIKLSTTTDRLRRSVALLFADAWRRIGVDVDVQVRDWSALYEDIQKGAFDAFSARWVPVIEPDLMRWVFSSSSIPAPGRAGGNRGGYVNADVDRWLDEARAAEETERRAHLYRLAAVRVREDLPVIPLWFEQEFAAHAARLQGFRIEKTVSLLPLAEAKLAPMRAR